ncbi:MAG: extracellular solute-binding protein [Clostridiales bacterium]|jgi:multiple sugar transport system substrate-binding protein|nr:extracellular solute-binding protein [Clostridiales bacterium]
MIKKLFLILLLFSLVACNSRIDDKVKIQLEPEPEPEITIDPDLLDNDKIVITYASGRDDTETIIKLIDEYNTNSDEYFVKYQELPYDYSARYNYIYNTMGAGDISFDAVEVNYSWIPGLAHLNYIEPLDSLVERGGWDKNAYLESALNASVYNGGLWALPFNISAGFLYIRSDVAGEVPKTWDELIEVSKAYKGTSGLKYSYIMPGVRSQMIFIEALEFIYSYGGEFFNQDGELNVNKEGIVKGLNKLAEIYFSDYVPDDLAAINNQEARSRFADGDSVFLRSDVNAWVYSNSAGSNVVGKFSIAPLPSGDSGVSTVLDGNANVINSASKNKDAAFEFIKYLSEGKAQRELVLSAGGMPVLLEAFTDADVISVNPYFETDKFIDTINNAVSQVKTIQYKDFTDIFIDELNLFLYQQKTAEQVADSIESRLKSALIKN